MSSQIAERALQDALRYRKAVLKYISPNDVGRTGSHQSGYYLPKRVWREFTDIRPERGVNRKQPVTVKWQDGQQTDSMITWYGRLTRSEYRLTRFGKGFPYLSESNIGDLLVLIPVSRGEFHAYVMSDEDDIEYIQAALALDITCSWDLYEPDATPEKADECIDRRFTRFVSDLTDFPDTLTLSRTTRDIVLKCASNFTALPVDQRLMRWLGAEFELFRLTERHLCRNETTGPFKDIDSFLSVANTIMNRRKARAGRSLENHVGQILADAGIPFSQRPNIDGNPDVIIPSKEAYEDPSFPDERLCMLAIKTTCKDRWRQVTREAKRIRVKHLLTVQRGISVNQLKEMEEAGVRLVVPRPIQTEYPAKRPVPILTVEQFLDKARALVV